MGIFRRISIRGGEFLATLLFILTINYGALMLLPGDPLTLMFEDVLLEENRETQAKLRNMYGLDGTPWERFYEYFLRMSRGDFGFSSSRGAPVIRIIRQSFPWTLLLVSVSLLFALPFGVGLGMETSLRRGTWKDSLMVAILTLLEGIPSFVKAVLVLLFFCVSLGWLPASGACTPFGSFTGMAYCKDVLRHVLAPGGTLILQEITGMAYHTRAGVLGVFSRPFMFVARSKGISGFRLRWDYLGRNNATLIIAHTTGMINRLLTGSIFVEVVFSYPGMGLTIQQAIAARDYPMVQGALFVLSIVILAVNFIGDLMVIRLNERS